MSELPSGTLTFLFTDIEGSTRLLRQLRDRYSAVLADHRRLLRGAFQRYGGEEIGTEGDSFFVVFRRARDAVAAAAEAQRAVAAHDWPEDAPIRVRMGMNTGEPTVDDDGSYVGLGVHLAARIASAGHGGQVLLSQATHALLQADEALDVDVMDLGEHWLKDFDRPERIFQLAGDGLPSGFPALKTLDKQAVEAAAGEGALPYKGLEAFQPQDAEFFFGREELIESLAARLAGARFLAVIGPSGSGKSSVVRAGLIPAVWRGAAGIAAGRDWKVILLTPTAEPLDELAVHLASEQGVSAGSLLADLRADPRNLSLATRQLMLDRPAGANVAIVVDQFEELFTLCKRDDDRRAFIDALVQTARTETGRAAVILSLRADFYGHCASYPELATLLEQSQALVGPMRERELRRAIERPAAAAGVQLEAGLADEILGDLGTEPGNLPLLSHALLETWKRRTGGSLTIADYREAGGVREAIARTADSVYDGLPDDQQGIARRIFMRLAEPGQGTEDTRRRAEIEELLPRDDDGSGVDEVLETLARERLITIGEGTVEVAHEALIREWPQFRRWLDEDREGLQIHRRLTEEAREWDQLGRSADVLYRGARLHATTDWAETREAELSPLERDFLDASRAAEEGDLAAARRRNRRLRGLAAALAALLVLAVAAAGFAVVQTRRAEAESRLATSRGLIQASAAALDERLDLALLLGLEAHRAKPNVETRSGLLRGVQRAQRVVRYLDAGAPASDVAISSDGSVLAAVSRERGLVLWDARTLRERAALTTDEATPNAVVALSADGRVVASDDGGRGLALWDAQSRRLLARVEGDTLVNDVAFSPVGGTIATAGDDGVFFWDRSGRKVGAGLPADERQPSLRLAFSPEGKTLAVASFETITLWDVARRARVGSLPLPRGNIEALAFGGDGRTIAAGGDVLTVWDVGRSPAARRTIPTGPVTAVALGGDRILAAARKGDRALVLWDLARNRELAEGLTGHTERVNALALTNDGRRLASASLDGDVIVWDASPDVGRIRLVDAGPPSPAVDFAPDGRKLAAASGSTAIVWRLGSDRRTTQFDLGGEPILDLDLDGRGRVVASTADGRIATWQASSAAGPRPRPVVPHAITSVEFAPDGRTVAAGVLESGSLGRVLFWDPLRGAIAGTPIASTGGVFDVAFSPDGGLLAVAGVGGTAFYDLSSRRSTGDRVPAARGARRIAFAPEGTVLAIAGEDVNVELWDVAANRRDGEPLTYPAELLGSVAFSPVGGLLATGTSGGHVVLWDLERRLPLGEPLAAHERAVLDVEFSRDGTQLASSGDDGDVLLHDVSLWLDDSALTERACAIVGRNLTRSEWETLLPDDDYRKTCPQWPAGPAT